MSQTESSPFIAIILTKTSGQFLCLGSILDANSILSAKNCFERVEKDEKLYVLAGYLKPYWGRDSQVKRVDKILKDADDLAILKLAHPLELTKTVKKVTLPPKNVTAILPARDVACEVGVYGFPVNKWDEPGSPLPKTITYHLKSAKVVDTAECEKVYKSKAPEGTDFTSENLSCIKGEAQFCWGSMGAPVMAMHDKGVIQLGVISMAGCDESQDHPMVNARLAPHISWIEANSQPATKNKR